MKVKSSGLYARFFLCLSVFSLFSVILFFSCCAQCIQTKDRSESSSDSSLSETDGADSCTKKLRIVSWNIETFFDGETDGNEYSEFIKSARWGRDAYAVRLDRLCSAIRSFDADVFVMEELEKESQLIDISNNLSSTFRLSKLYPYGCFATSPGSSIGCAVISRYPIANLKVHSLDVRTCDSKQPSMRPIMEVELCVGKKNLVIFVNHWKSKSGGESETEVWRNWQESVLANCMQNRIDKGDAVIACGDFNRDILDFSFPVVSKECVNVIMRTKPTSDIYACSSSVKSVGVYSPWFSSSGSLVVPGSYLFDNNWERIDNFFSAGKCYISSFSVETDGPWADSEGHPFGYSVWNGEGYSDHFPISASVLF